MNSFLLILISLLSAPTQSFLSSGVATRRHNSFQLQAGFLDFSDSKDRGNSDESPQPENRSNHRRRRRSIRREMTELRRQRLERERERETRFLSGDDLQNLRQQVLTLRNELIQTPSQSRKRELETAILQAQQMDAEFIYQVASERAEAAEHAGLVMEAARYKEEAAHARAALPQFNLEGLWVGKFGDNGFEIINCTYHGDTLIATKVTGDKNVPKGEVSFEVYLSPTANLLGEQQHRSSSSSYFNEDMMEQDGSNAPFSAGSNTPQPLEPIELNNDAAEQWGSRFLQRFQGSGQVASRGFRNAQWMEGQLILVGTSYFSFAWLPISQSVFFGRASPQMTLKLLRESAAQDQSETSQDRFFAELCWEETEMLEDEVEVSDSHFISGEQQDYYGMEGCFE